MPNIEHSTTELSQLVSEALSAFSSEIMRSSVGDILQLLRREGLSMPRATTLMFLSKRGAISVSEISDYLNLTLGTTSHIVDQLVEGGYVERRECAHDRRQKQITLTEHGHSFVQEFTKARFAEMNKRLATLPEPLLAQFLEVTTEVVAHLRSDT